MTNTKEVTLSIEQLKMLLDDYKENNNSLNIKRKGSFDKLPSGNYRFRYSFKGTLYSDIFEEIKSDEEAKQKLADWTENIENGLYNKNNQTVSEWCQDWLDKQVRPNSSGDRSPNKYKNFLNNWFLPQFGNKKIKSITMEHLNDYFNWLKTQKTKYKPPRENTLLSVGTLEKYHSIVHAMFETAKLWGKITTNPCPPIGKLNFYVFSDGSPRIIEKNTTNTINAKVEEDIDYYSKSEYDKAINLIENELEQIKNSSLISDKEKHFQFGRLLAILLDFKTGLRRSELYALTKNDFDLENCFVNISKTRQLTKSKGNQSLITKTLTSKRKVSIPEKLIENLKYFLNLTPDFFDYIFEDFSIDGLSDFWDRWQIKNELRNITFHDIRHTHASILFLLGVDIRIISQRLGHKSVQTTEQTYLVILMELRQKVSNQINDL